MNGLLDPELEKELKESSERFVNDLIKNPQEVGKTIDTFLKELIEILGLEDMLGEIKGVDEKIKQGFMDALVSLRIILLLKPYEECRDEFSAKFDELFGASRAKDPERLKAVFLKSRPDLFRKLMNSFMRSWRIVPEKGLSKEAVLNNKFSIVKSLSEGIYRELLIVIQEMMQIAFDKNQTTSFGTIIGQLESAPIDLKVFVNRTAYNIRNSESHENVEFGKDNTITLYDKGKVIQKITEKDLDEAIRWLTDFTNSAYRSLQKNYFGLMQIGHTTEDRIGYISEGFLDGLPDSLF